MIVSVMLAAMAGCTFLFVPAGGPSDSVMSDDDAGPDAEADGDADVDPACDPGETLEARCYRCGHQTRTCDADGHWQDWSACEGGNGECEPDDYEYECCPTAPLARERTCDENCTWSAWSDCNSSNC